MKKIVTLIFTAFLLVALAHKASSQPSGSTWLTANLGLTNGWILNQNSYGNAEMDYGTKFGVLARLGVNHYINTKYGISTGIGFGNTGQNYVGDQRGAKASRKVNLNYIQVPIIAMKQLCDPQHPCWLTFGPQLMFLTSARQNFTREEDGPLTNPQYLPEGKIDVTGWYKPMDIMLNLGVTNLYDLRKNDKLKIMLSLNAALGLMDINSKDYRISNIGHEYKASHNFYLGAHFGFLFRPGKLILKK